MFDFSVDYRLPDRMVCRPQCEGGLRLRSVTRHKLQSILLSAGESSAVGPDEWMASVRDMSLYRSYKRVTLLSSSL